MPLKMLSAASPPGAHRPDNPLVPHLRTWNGVEGLRLASWPACTATRARPTCWILLAWQGTIASWPRLRARWICSLSPATRLLPAHRAASRSGRRGAFGLSIPSTSRAVFDARDVANDFRELRASGVLLLKDSGAKGGLPRGHSCRVVGPDCQCRAAQQVLYRPELPRFRPSPGSGRRSGGTWPSCAALAVNPRLAARKTTAGNKPQIPEIHFPV